MVNNREVRRREFVYGLAAGVVVGGTGVAGYQKMSAGHAKPATLSIDPNTIRRRGVGLRGYDQGRAYSGFTLFAPMTGTGLVYLIDMRGNVVHTWKMPYRPGLYGYLTDKGTHFYNAQIPNDTFLGKSPFMGGAVMEADWNGKSSGASISPIITTMADCCGTATCSSYARPSFQRILRKG